MSVMPQYEQIVMGNTRENKTLDHFYTKIKNSYKSVSRGNFGESDHTTIFLIPTYKNFLRVKKKQEKLIKIWSDLAISNLKDCLDSTDWNIFQENNSLDEHT